MTTVIVERLARMLYKCMQRDMLPSRDMSAGLCEALLRQYWSGAWFSHNLSGVF